MLKGLPSRDSSRRFVFKHLLEEIKALVVDLFFSYQLSQIERFEVGPLDSGEIRVLTDAWPGLVGRPPHDPEDLHQLLLLVLTAEQRLVDGELGEDASHRPDVHWSGILVHLTQQLRASVVECDDTLSIRLNRYADGSSQSEISQFD